MNTSEPRPTGRSKSASSLEEALARIKPRPWSELTPDERARRQEIQEIFLQVEDASHRELA
jgi:hypothetical protein